jgi:rubrerythrin
VDSSQVQRAKEVLADLRQEKPAANWESEAVEAIEGWICPLCDTQVEDAVMVCPACSEARPRKKKRRRE